MTQPSATRDRSGLGRWIADQRDRGATWSDIVLELNISEPQARALEKRYLDAVQARERELQCTLW